MYIHCIMLDWLRPDVHFEVDQWTKDHTKYYTDFWNIIPEIVELNIENLLFA